mmetsp:Transcript_7163/g.10269  ORF Transcript_7163/g.10269 Transcript_7163/m.10269 type:complete len:619 (+) Transcript_7163:444-2300(+)|eukprot:CAMPEP_0184872616 /NCGR_PEP_ID=MMETSP0580-20130426/41394_1 /TAXON_ID=1118495 /ORGANISM="Dactyliosolen fragilissimus" /LENGTH=618 /DNA_ID=CAMNT_0027375447 /DNA_START=1624 /DNA_END=3480 /DNA_ORIENTATION=-
MWPRTAEERARGRNTGFVCFMNREDAQEAMDAYQESDPLKTGRLMCLRWGKNVKKSVKRGTGGVPIPPITRKKKSESLHKKYHDTTTERNPGTSSKFITQTNLHHSTSTSDIHQTSPKRRKKDIGSLTAPDFKQNIQAETYSAQHSAMKYSTDSQTSQSNQTLIQIPAYDPTIHASTAIRVIPPSNLSRLKFITTVASFVAKDGSILENKLIERETKNPKFSFLSPYHDTKYSTTSLGLSNENRDNVDPDIIKERIFYRWRIFAFMQGDGFDSWRTEPFIMIQPNGRFWIPPSLNAEAARKEEQEVEKREERIRTQQEKRRLLAGKKTFMTGRQLEHAKFGGSATAAAEGAVKLNEYEMEQWNDIIHNKLCASRDAICEAMAFCFDKSGAAKQISELLRKSLLDDRIGVSVETRIARLYLMSDVLFNSQQPGVKNAFRYRDAIEGMAVEVFQNLGKARIAGRMTFNKLQNAVNSVLDAWTKWSVYNSTFLDELEARFAGKEWPLPQQDVVVEIDKDAFNEDVNQKEDTADNNSDGLSIKAEYSCKKDTDFPNISSHGIRVQNEFEEVCDDDRTVNNNEDLDGEVLGDEDIDGESLEDEDICEESDADFDGEPLSENEH